MSLYPYPLENLFGRVLSPFERFLQRTTAGGIILVGTTILTLIIAHSPWGAVFHHVWETPVRVGLGGWDLALTLHQWINEGCMTLFFLVVGLELKREVMIGELSSLRQAMLPVAGAFGGIIVPAMIYHVMNPIGPAAAGWGIPMATDIAFAVGILVLLSWRIPRNLIIFLTALAIADDLGAVLVIAFFYTKEIHWGVLGMGAIFLFTLILLNRGGIRSALPYALLGLLLWIALLKSGIHATVSGVLLAFTIPAHPAFTPGQFHDRLEELQKVLEEGTCDARSMKSTLENQCMSTVADNLEKAAIAVQSPQQRLEHLLAPWVTFIIIPLFALANAGIDFTSSRTAAGIFDSVTLGVFLGLLFGKFIGIGGMTWLAVKTGLAKLPSGILWRHVFGASWLGGIGFTMSIFIAQLAFPESPNDMEAAKVGIFLASAISAVVGLLWLFLSAVHEKPQRSRPE